MSILNPEHVNCPNCSKSVDFEWVDSINADRRPDLRDAILEGSFQRQACSHCAEVFRAEPQLNYLDMGRQQWIAAMPIHWLDQWEEVEESTSAAYARILGSQAKGPAAALGAGIKPRLVFGWHALTEALIADEAGLDRTVLEMTKLAVMRGLDEQPLEIGDNLRLVEVNADAQSLSMLIVPRDHQAEGGELVIVPMAVYNDVVANEKAWEVLREQLQAGVFTDVARLIRGAPTAEQSESDQST
jgi:hypothetical protein